MNGKLRNMTTVYLFRGEQVLLLYRRGGKVVDLVWTGSAGGHFEDYELNDATACVLRETEEELGLRPEHMRNLALRYVTLRNVRGEIRQNYYFFATLADDAPMELTSNEGNCKWFSLSEIGELEMPFTAKVVMEHYVKEGRFTDQLYAGIADEHAVHFSPLPQA